MLTNKPLQYSMYPEFPFLKSLISCYVFRLLNKWQQRSLYINKRTTHSCDRCRPKCFFKLQQHCFKQVLSLVLFILIFRKLRNFPFTNWVPSVFSFSFGFLSVVFFFMFVFTAIVSIAFKYIYIVFLSILIV